MKSPTRLSLTLQISGRRGPSPRPSASSVCRWQQQIPRKADNRTLPVTAYPERGGAQIAAWGAARTWDFGIRCCGFYPMLAGEALKKNRSSWRKPWSEWNNSKRFLGCSRQRRQRVNGLHVDKISSIKQQYRDSTCTHTHIHRPPSTDSRILASEHRVHLQ
jgi:hypothetical protein